MSEWCEPVLITDPLVIKLSRWVADLALQVHSYHCLECKFYNYNSYLLIVCSVNDYLVVTAAHTLHCLTVGNIFRIGSLLIFILLLFSFGCITRTALFGTSATSAATASSATFRLVTTTLQNTLVFYEERFCSIVSRYQPAVKELVQIPTAKKVQVNSLSDSQVFYRTGYYLRISEL